ncbi:hypothetical protein ATO3_18945 [Marinibacterium profundimaris]|uniref:Uncharacterized protein n=1 Tax=Marinibacterium profundimaris TaxID=1679460 RepID=A0A225NJA9_9RHOB|nr:hypothetical protein ATO3_18945 [Marinibacterium profundimaris]
MKRVSITDLGDTCKARPAHIIGADGHHLSRVSGDIIDLLAKSIKDICPCFQQTATQIRRKAR